MDVATDDAVTVRGLTAGDAAAVADLPPRSRRRPLAMTRRANASLTSTPWIRLNAPDTASCIALNERVVSPTKITIWSMRHRQNAVTIDETAGHPASLTSAPSDYATAYLAGAQRGQVWQSSASRRPPEVTADASMLSEVTASSSGL